MLYNFLCQASQPVVSDTSWSPQNVMALVTMLVTAALSIIAAIKAFQADTRATNTEQRQDRAAARTDALMLNSPPPSATPGPTSTHTRGPTNLPNLSLAWLTGGVVAASLLFSAGGCASAERREYQMYRDGLWNNTTTLRQDLPLLAQALAGDSNGDGVVDTTPSADPLGIRNLPIEARQVWLDGRLEPVKKLEQWHLDSGRHDIPSP